MKQRGDASLDQAIVNSNKKSLNQPATTRSNSTEKLIFYNFNVLIVAITIFIKRCVAWRLIGGNILPP